MPQTYEAITTFTATGSESTVTFNSIPQTYTDLVLVTNSRPNPAKIRFNNDTGNNYDEEFFASNESGYVANQSLNDNYIYGYYYGPAQSSLEVGMSIFNIANYTSSTYYKTVVTRGAGTTVTQGSNTLNGQVWKNTAAITRIDISNSGGAFSAGCVFTLYGILAA